MAGTTTIQLQVSNKNGLMTNNYSYTKTGGISQSGQGVFRRVVSVTTTEASVEFVGITTPGLVIMQNLSTSTSTSDYVTWGNTAADPLGILNPDGAPAMLTWKSGENLYFDANSATCKVYLEVHEA